MKTSSKDYVTRVHRNPAELDATAWDGLVGNSPGGSPFMRHAFLLALHQSGSATPETGWAPHFLTVWKASSLVGACALYLKHHSYGEYVFDWAWADAYHRHGLAYYPKLLAAVPFTPVPGPRLLARDDEARSRLLEAIQALAQEGGLSSAHLLFLDEADRTTAQRQGWMLRGGVQFHWHNRNQEPYRDFDDFLAQLQRDKRKKILQERRKVADAGIRFETRQGAEISERDWDFFHRCYRTTYAAHGSTPYLTRRFFSLSAQALPQHWLLFLAARGAQRLGASLVVIDPERAHAYGRYWGAVEQVPCLHFEACYYQPLQWCIEQRYTVFEGGAQGEHKMARGLLPVQTWSAHWLSHAGFAGAVADFLAREGHGVQAYVDELRDRVPFKGRS